ncbi:MAG: hypothetical protein PV344_00905, partial [Anaplasma sp.]|nr:hypothetical protein [Anaplasma sp.]
MCKRAQLNVIYFDLSKAPDVVDHNIFLNRLKQIEPNGSEGIIACLVFLLPRRPPEESTHESKVY